MQPFWEIVASNALIVIVLAAVVGLLGIVWKNAAWLHLLWVLVLLKLVTPPLLTVPLALPTWQESPGTASQSPAELSHPESLPATASRERPPASADRGIQESPAPGQDGVFTVAQVEEIPWLALLGWTWGLGMVLVASRQTYRIAGFSRLLASSTLPSSAVLDRAERVGKRLGLERIPEIRMLPVRLSPLVWSLGGRPRVLLPTLLFEQLDSAAQEAILAHELAHVRRKDHWVRLLEVVVATLFWWHPVVWWAARRLQELEDQCCDAMVVDLKLHDARTYAAALVETLDFLSDRSVVAPLGATAAKTSTCLTRRIRMLKNPTPQLRLTAGRLALLAAVAAIPMALAFAAQPPEPAAPAPADEPQEGKEAAIQTRAVNKLVKDFPEQTDMSTPESAQAAWNRAWAREDDQAVLDLSWIKWGKREVEKMKQYRENNPEYTGICNEALLNTEIVEVITYHEDYAAVISRLVFPEGKGRNPFSRRSFGKINGLWKNLGEDRAPSLEAARESFDRKKDNLWRNFVEVRDKVQKGQPAISGSEQEETGARIAPGAPLGISVEKADLMGRVEWTFMHGGRDVTARKSIEWGEVEKHDNGNRSLRYKCYATIWDRDVYIMNMVYTFDPEGNLLSRENVEGYPQKKEVKPVDVNTPEGVKELVEKFFTQNYHDITARETVEWGELTKTENGNVSIRYKYRATIWDKEKKMMNQVFTFDPKGEYVSAKHVEGSPQDLK